MKKMYLTMCMAIGIVAGCHAQYNFTEISINPGSSSSTPRYFIPFNGEMYFQAQNNFDTELYRSNGTAAGTALAANISSNVSSSPQSLDTVNGKLIFNAFEIATGQEPYVSDGTAAGTQLLADIRSGGSGGLSPNVNEAYDQFVYYNNHLYFFANDGVSFNELWRTDGTTAGTQLVADVNPNGGNTTNTANNIIVYNDTLYFTASDGTFGIELWRTDGTAAGTEMVADINPGSGGSSPDNFTLYSGELYFSANDGTNGNELWKTNGSVTTLVADVLPGATGGLPSNMTVYNGLLVFKAKSGTEGTELHIYDGNVVSLLADINTAFNTGSIQIPRYFEYNGWLYFLAEESNEHELWKTDGTMAGTTKAFSNAAVGLSANQFLNTVLYDGKMLFQSFQQLWITDGTAAGTQQLTDNGNPNVPIQISGYRPIIFNNNYYFGGLKSGNGVELWCMSSATNPPPVQVTTCNSYTSPSGNYVWTTNGTYTDTLIDISGNDSIVTIDLTVLPSSTSGYSVFECESHTSPSGNYIWTASGTYSDTITAANGCDSIITIQLNIYAPATSQITVADCNGYMAPSGTTYWTTSGTYYDTLTSAVGCDSIITVMLTVYGETLSSVNAVSCGDYLSPGGNVYTASGNYSDTLTSVNGCDSIIVTSLTINEVETSVTQNGFTLEATATNATYQWIDCENGDTPIVGATGSSFTPTADGSFACIIQQNGCVDTTDCYIIIGVGMSSPATDQLITLYPNPTTSAVQITLPNPASNTTVHCYDMSGKRVSSRQFSQQQTITVDLGDSEGMYLLEVIADGKIHRLRCIKIKQ